MSGAWASVGWYLGAVVGLVLVIALVIMGLGSAASDLGNFVEKDR